MSTTASLALLWALFVGSTLILGGWLYLTRSELRHLRGQFEAHLELHDTHERRYAGEDEGWKR